MTRLWYLPAIGKFLNVLKLDRDMEHSLAVRVERVFAEDINT